MRSPPLARIPDSAGTPTGGSAAARSGRQIGDSRVFATVPEPGHLEGIVVSGDIVFSGTTGAAAAFATGVKSQSVLFAFDRATGALRSTLPVRGERLERGAPLNGISGLAVDAAGRLYVADIQGRILRFDLDGDSPRQEVYAVIPDLPSVASSAVDRPSTVDARSPLPNGIVFDGAGNLYVTDSWQAAIFRVPPGGGLAEVWFRSERMSGLFGANGIRVSPDGTSLYFAVTRDRLERSWIFRLPLADRPRVSDLDDVMSWPPRARALAPAGADGIAFGASGLLYVVLGGDEEVATIDLTTGAERRFASPLLYNPAGLAFDDEARRLLVTNHAFFDDDPSHWTIVDLYVDDREAPLERPVVP